MRVFVYTWDSDEKSKRLTKQEAETLFNVSWELMTVGELAIPGLHGASRVVYWERLPIGAQ